MSSVSLNDVNFPVISKTIAFTSLFILYVCMIDCSSFSAKIAGAIKDWFCDAPPQLFLVIVEVDASNHRLYCQRIRNERPRPEVKYRV